MKIFETHAHYDDEQFDSDRDTLLSKMLGTEKPEQACLDALINVGASLDGSRKSLMLAEKYENVYAAVGVHPEEVGNLNIDDMAWLEKNAGSNPKVVAVGEIGLDYHYPEPSKDIQIRWFRQQLCVARKVGKPVIIHSRDACSDTLECMRAEKAADIGGVIHCYSYSREAAREYLNMGFYFGIGGVVTFKNARKLAEAVSYIPEEYLLLETDCPYMAPEPLRGRRNDSRNLIYVAEKIGQIKGLSAQEVICITNRNARRLFQERNGQGIAGAENG